MSLVLIEPIVNTTTSAPITASITPQVVPVASTTGIYVGAQLIIDPYLSTQEIVVVTAVIAGVSFTAIFTEDHLSGATVIAATFPVQQPTDPFFTQSEVLSYLARAQNEFLARVPCIFAFCSQTVSVGQIYQSSPGAMIEINRIASSAPNLSITSLTRTAGTVTAIVSVEHGFSQYSRFSVLPGNGLSDASFVGAFSVASVIDPYTFTYVQNAANGSATGGLIGLWTRLYEISQEELTMRDRNWMVENHTALYSWFEDRSGNYKWGVGERPGSNFPVELLYSIRDTDTLALTDYFLVPDIMLHLVKYRALEFCFQKDGQMHDESRAQYCAMRFNNGILACQRWLDGILSPTPVMAGRGRR